jgi:hypothetical protein
MVPLLLAMPVVALAAVLVMGSLMVLAMRESSDRVHRQHEEEVSRQQRAMEYAAKRMAEESSLSTRMDSQAALMKSTIEVLAKLSETSNNLAHSILSARGQGIKLDRQAGEMPTPPAGVALPSAAPPAPEQQPGAVVVIDPDQRTSTTPRPSAVETVRGKPS